MPDEGNVPGSFLHGSDNLVLLDVIQEFGLESVNMTVEYIDVHGDAQTAIAPASWNKERGCYTVNIDTAALNMADGAIKTYVTAVDRSGKKTITTDMVYTVKNTPPQIEMTIPKLKGDDYETWDFDSGSPPSIFIGNDIMGIATDLYGIARGYPQIMIWPVKANGEPEDGVTLDADNAAPGAGRTWGTWRTVLDDKGKALTSHGLKAIMFRWPTDTYTVGRYHFKIRVKDLFGITNIYPYRLDSGLPAGAKVNKYMALELAKTTSPIIKFDAADRYYNRTAPLTRTVSISAENGIAVVNAIVNNSMQADFSRGGINFAGTLHSGNSASGKYTVTIPISDIPGNSSDDMMLHVMAEDAMGNSSIVSLPFILDVDPPAVEFIDPFALETNPEPIPELTSTVKFQGTAFDNQRVRKMYYALGRTETNNPLLGAGAEDTTGWTDTALDTAAPRNFHKSGDKIRAAWYGSLNNWRWEFENIADLYVSPTKAVDSGGNYYLEDYQWNNNLWYLPVKFKLVDYAGNASITAVKLIVDPDRDRPDVSFNSPANNDTVGGEVRVSGTAVDNEIVYDVQIRVTAQSDAEIGTGACTWKITNDPANDDFVPATMTGSGSTVNWYYTLNEDNALTPRDLNQLRNVKIEVRARDASIYSPNSPKPVRDNHIIKTLNLNFSATVPTIDQVQILRASPSALINEATQGDAYGVGAMVSGDLVLRARIRDDSGINSIKIKGGDTMVFGDDLKASGFSGSQPYRPWVQKTPSPDTGIGEEYYLFIPLKTNAGSAAGGLWNGRFYNSAGTYSIDIQVVDDTSPVGFMAQQTIALQIDNYYPGANYTGNVNVTGTQYTVMGNAWDTADSGIGVYEIDKVVVYFSRPGGPVLNGIDIGNRVSLDNSPVNPAEWTAAQQVKIGRKSAAGSVAGVEGLVAALPWFPILTPGAASGQYVSNNAGIAVNAAGGTIGTIQSFRGVPNKEWTVQLDSTKLPEGPLYVNYVVFDSAGNASYFRDSIYVANNRPVITGLRLGTDINRNGVIDDPAEYFDYDPAPESKAFRIRNNRYNVKFDVQKGNGQKHYRVSYATPALKTVTPATIVKGNVYTIASMGSITVDEWINMGVINGPSSNNYNGVSFVANNSYTGAHTAQVYAYQYGGSGGSANTFLEGNDIGSGEISGFIPPQPFDKTSFGSALIPDSDPKSNGEIVTPKQRHFIIKVYDSTVTNGAAADELNSLADVAVVAVDIDNTDSKAPVVALDPFYWNSAADNSLYQSSRENGHIELEADLPAAFSASAGLADRDPKVSGKVTFRGTVFDNNTIGGVYFRITNFTDAGAVVKTIGGISCYEAAVFSGGTWISANRFANGWKFSVNAATQKLNQDGHYIEWQLDFDSRFIDGTASLDNVLTVVAQDTRDEAPGPNTSAIPGSFTQTTDYAKTAQYRFDVVPYISGIETTVRLEGGLKNNNIRSADGKYSIIQGSNNGFITVNGFNLAPVASGVTIQNAAQRDAHRANPALAPNGTPMSFSSVVTDRTSFTMTNNASSGYLAVWGGNPAAPIGSLNNINNDNALGSYRLKLSTDNIAPGANYLLRSGISNGTDEENMPNRNADRAITKNITLTDDRYLQFYTVRETNVKNGQYPVMVMNGNNPVFGYIDPAGGSSGRPKAGGTGVTIPGTGAGVTVGTNTAHYTDARPQRVEFNYSDAGVVYKEYLIKSLVSDQMAMAVDSVGRFGHYTVFNYSSGSSEYIYDRYAELWTDGAFGWTGGTPYLDWPKSTDTGRYVASNSNNTAMSFEAPMTGMPTGTAGIPQLNRFLYPRLIIRGDSINSYATNYLAYFDDATTARQIIFRTFQVGTNAGLRENRLSFTDPQYDNQGRMYDTFTNYKAGSPIGNSGRNIAATGASKYFDMGVMSDGRVVIVYLDESDGRLKLRYTSSPIDGSVTTGLSFTENTGLKLPDYVGMYVSMFVDPSDHIHISAFNYLNSELWYIFIPSYNAAAYKAVPVDQFGSVGYWTDIKVNSAGVPYIAYYNAAEAGGRDSIKLACAKNAVTDTGDVKGGVDVNGYTTNDWEYRTVPAKQPPQGGVPGFQKVSLGFMLNGDAMLGYLGANIEFSYPVGER